MFVLRDTRLDQCYIENDKMKKLNHFVKLMFTNNNILYNIIKKK